MSALSFNNTEIAFRAKSDEALRRSHWLFKAIERPWLVKMGTPLVKAALKLRLPVDPLIESTIFRQFCGGESIEESARTIEDLGRFGIGSILDYSVEGLGNDASFEATMGEILRTIELAARNKNVPFCVFKMTGIARFELMAKIQAKDTLADAEKLEWKRAQDRLARICGEAHAKSVRVFVDAEESWIQDVIDAEAHAMMLAHNRERAIVYNTVQLYRHDRLAYVRRTVEEARREGYFLGLKLVRGAYMEKERAYYRGQGKPSPIQPDKRATDAAYDEALRFCVDHLDRVAICAGTHNEKSNQLLTELMAKKKVERHDERVYFAQLLGMSDHISYNLAHAGYHVAKYVPYGPVHAVFPYLARRAEENTSIQGQTGRELSLILTELKRRETSRAGKPLPA